MHTLIRTPASVIWLVLVGATAFSWALGSEHGFAGGAKEAAGIAVLVVAFIKVRFIGLYFMELREAPIVLRGLLESYCAVVGTLVVTLFVLGA